MVQGGTDRRLDGVADYTAHLVPALRESGVDVVPVRFGDRVPAVDVPRRRFPTVLRVRPSRDGHAVPHRGRAFAAAEEAQAYRAELTALADDRVESTGHLPAAEVSAILRGADVAVLPFTAGVTTKSGALLTVLERVLGDGGGADVAADRSAAPGRVRNRCCGGEAPEHRVVVTGTEQERELAAAVGGENLAGRLDLTQLAALIAETRLLISADTGVAHL